MSEATSYNRREAIQLALLASGTLLLLDVQAMNTPEDFDFLAVNDLHYHDQECDAWFTQAFAAMRESAPRAEFILLNGDLADQGKSEQLAGLHRLLPSLGIPYHAVPGNHDCASATDWTTYQELFADQTNSHFAHRGWHFFGLDTTEGNNWRDTTIASSTIGYLEKQLTKVAKTTPIVLFTHFPLGENIVLPPQTPDAPSYNFRPLNAETLLATLDGYNLQAVFSGHFHSYTERKRSQATLTTNKCCSRIQKNHDGTLEKGWFVCEARSGKIARRFVEIPEVLRG